MLPFDSSLFGYKLVFMAELCLAEGLATYTLRKRKLFLLRVAAALVFVFAVAFFFPLFTYTSAYITVMFIFLFMITLLALKFCYREPWSNIIFCGITAYTVQHSAYSAYSFLTTLLDLDTFGVYEPDMQPGESQFTGFALLAYFSCYALIYWAVWATVEYRIREKKQLTISNLPLLCLLSLIVLVDIVINAIVVYNADAFTPKAIVLAVYFANILNCVLAVWVQYTLLGRKRAEAELEATTMLWHHDQKLYEANKGNVEFINEKYHDLKRQIATLRGNVGIMDEKTLSEIESTVNRYDCTVKTGNSALDVVLTEKNLLCEKKNIRFSCMTDVGPLTFMRPYDLYTMLENALQNAIEAASKVKDEARLFVRVRVAEKCGVLGIYIENGMEGELVLRGGMPETTKGDTRFHGFGLKSIARVVEQYGGGMKVKGEGGIFSLSIAIPLPGGSGKRQGE